MNAIPLLYVYGFFFSFFGEKSAGASSTMPPPVPLSYSIITIAMEISFFFSVFTFEWRAHRPRMREKIIK